MMHDRRQLADSIGNGTAHDMGRERVDAAASSAEAPALSQFSSAPCSMKTDIEDRQAVPIEPKIDDAAGNGPIPPPFPNFSEIGRPVARRTSLTEPLQLPNPPFGGGQGGLLSSLELDLNEEDGQSIEASSAQISNRMNAPQLRIRPIQSKAQKEEPTLSSPLARRGESERNYLQGQLRAEAQIRRRQELHNEERKRRESGNLVAEEGLDVRDNEDDGDMLSMMEKLNFRDDNLKRFMPKRQQQGGRHELMEVASSPPAILMKTFKRSVSAVLADSSMPEDSNLLFFPSGVPLLKGEDDGAAEAASQGSLLGDEDNSLDGSPSASPRSQGSSTSDEISPSLVPNDIIWQFGSFDEGDVPGDLTVPTAAKSTKKVTLRPKMNQKHNITTPEPPSREFKPIRSRLKSSDSVSSSDSRSKGVTFETPDKFPTIRRDDALAASESFQQLSFEDLGRTQSRERLDSDMSVHTHDSGSEKKQDQQFVFSSPEAQSFRKVPEPLLSDSNFKTPDNSEHSRRSSRSRLCYRMPRLPELSMPEALDVPFKGRASHALEALAREDQKAISLLAEAASLEPEPLSASNYRTPDNSFSDRRSRQFLAELPRLPGLGQPSGPALGPSRRERVEENQIPSEPLRTISMNAQHEEPLCDNAMCTPDQSHSAADRRVVERMAERCVPPSMSYLRNAHVHQSQKPGGLDSACREEDAEASSIGLPRIPSMSSGGLQCHHETVKTPCSPLA